MIWNQHLLELTGQENVPAWQEAGERNSGEISQAGGTEALCMAPGNTIHKHAFMEN